MFDINYFRTNNLPIPFELSYSNKINLNDKILLKCEKCGLEYIHKYSTILKREYEPNKSICNNCLLNIGYKVRVSLPYELQRFNDGIIPWNIYLKYKDHYNSGSKLWIKIICQECGEESNIQWRKVAKRLHSKDLPICSKCIQKYKACLPEVRKKNSQVQLIAQNRPEVIQKQKAAQRRLLLEDKNYIEKRTKTKQYLTGYYNNIYFASSYELSFLIYYENIIKKCKLRIPYIFNGEERYYIPDYILNLSNGKMIIEIKGYINNKVKDKIKYAKIFVQNSEEYIDYKIYYYKDLINMPNFNLIDSFDKLSKLDKNQLQIIYYPKKFRNI